MRSDLVVYTAIFGNYDVLKPARYPDVRCVCFTDEVQGVEGWEEIVVERKFVDPKRESSMYLALAHHILEDVEYSVYHGGAGELLQHPDELLEILDGAEIATFRHPNRDCVYDEAHAVINYGKADVNLVRLQMGHYKTLEYPAHNGLVASAIIARKHNERVARFNEHLISLMCRFTPPDQLAIDPALWVTGADWTPIPGGEASYDRLGPNDYYRQTGHR